MARIKTSPADFVVEEIPAYEPAGDGDHLFVTFRKQGRGTAEVVSDLARGLGIRARDIGVAGLKDKHAVTTQTVSIDRQGAKKEGEGDAAKIPSRDEFERRLRALSIDNVTVLDARWHRNKLKTGHLRGNRFTILVREVSDIPTALARFEEISRLGVPNAFGEQRFGPEHRNVARAKEWLSGRDRGPRDPKARRFSFSAWQSYLFNQVLAAREQEGTWATVLEGDLAMKHASGGLFPCTDETTDRARALVGEISATGPMLGAAMRWPDGAPRAIEDRVVRIALEELGVSEDTEFLARLSQLGEGTRRPLRQWVENLAATAEQPDGIRVQFVLPSGTYATTVLARAIPEISHDSEGQADEGTTAS